MTQNTFTPHDKLYDLAPRPIGKDKNPEGNQWV